MSFIPQGAAPVSYTHLSLMEMLEQAQDVETLLAIRTELSDVQYQLESYEAQKRAYDDLVAYSTVDVTAVSYTHLDVYKRQACVRSARRGWLYTGGTEASSRPETEQGRRR